MILKYALANAYQYGKADFKSVTSKVFSDPELRKKAKELIPEIKKAVETVNKMKKSEIEAKLKEIAPELMEKKKKDETKELPPLEGAKKGQVRLRLPPEPNGYLHIGHGLSFWLNNLYKEMYEGELVLKLEDTNPIGEKNEYYDAIIDDLKWLGIKPDKTFVISENLQKIEKGAEILIDTKKAYVCKCSSEAVKEARMKGEADPCRKHTKSENKELWRDMFAKKPYTLRWIGNPSDQNTVLRDPILYRVVDMVHPHTKVNHVCYPTYDLASAATDGMLEITHVLRSEEFLMRAPLHSAIIEALGMKAPRYVHFGRFAMDGSPTSKRKVKPLVEDKLVDGWDDPRLATIRGIRRRGILAKTIKDLAMASGPYRGKRIIDWKLLLGLNRKNLDPIAKRVFVIEEPKKFSLDGKEMKVKLKNHPSEDLGERTLELKSFIYLEKKDVEARKMRLKGAYNIEIKKDTAKEIEGGLIRPIVQWISSHDECEIWRSQKLFTNNTVNKIRKTKAVCEKRDWKAGEFVQMERIGFARVDSTKPLRLIYVSD